VESSISKFRPRSPLTPDALRASFAGTRPPRDPLDVTLPPGTGQWPASTLKRLTAALRPAGVLIPIMDRAGGMTVLFTQRAADLTHHPGQVSFPGGSMEEYDENLRATALRETHEEVGITPQQVSVIGYLRPTPTTTGFAVTPVIGIVEPSSELIIDSIEVEYAFEVPLEFLLDEGNVQHAERDFYGHKVPVVEFHFEDRRIWGATANMLQIFKKIVIKK
jgi:8-oxo-dGTP pyrophosphatase MutT (NUDIX family)